MVNWFTHPQVMEESYNVVDLVAFCNHMRWLKPCTDNLKTDLRDWEDTFAAHLSEFNVIGWKRKMGETQKEPGPKKVIPCRICNHLVKQLEAPMGFYGGNLFGRQWNRSCIPLATQGNEWVAGTLGESIDYPLMGLEWRQPGDASATSELFLEKAASAFSLRSVRELAEVGDRLVVDNEGEIRFAARKIQEIEMRKMNEQMEGAKELLHFDPVLRDQVIQMHRRGLLPHFHGSPPEGPRRSGLPYEPSKTVGMVEKMWKDVQHGRVMVITSKTAGPDAPLIATPTTTALKKLPDRSISTDFRLISDLRYTNLFCIKEDFPDAQLTDITRVAERAVTVKRKWPNLPARCTKSDIDSASKRIRTHPDMSLILCAEFGGGFSRWGLKSRLYSYTWCYHLAGAPAPVTSAW